MIDFYQRIHHNTLSKSSPLPLRSSTMSSGSPAQAHRRQQWRQSGGRDTASRGPLVFARQTSFAPEPCSNTATRSCFTYYFTFLPTYLKARDTRVIIWIFGFSSCVLTRGFARMVVTGSVCFSDDPIQNIISKFCEYEWMFITLSKKITERACIDTHGASSLDYYIENFYSGSMLGYLRVAAYLSVKYVLA